MKNTIEKLLYDMTNFGKKAFEMHFMEKCFKELGFETFEKLNGRILHWQKAIKNPDKAFPNEAFHNDRLILSDLFNKEYKDFFRYCPELQEIFTLHEGKITYNENLTEEEIEEVKQYINENHRIQIRLRKRIP